jgi:hypothetical protein
MLRKLKTEMRSFFFISALVSAALSLTFDGNAVLVIPSLTFSSKETSGVQLAIKDFVADFYKVLGYAPVMLNSPPAAGELAPGTTVIYLGSIAACPYLLTSFPSISTFTSDWESHGVMAFPAASSPGGYASIVATGAGVRGAIFGIYTFSEEILNVSPYFYIADYLPSYLGNITIADNFSSVYPSPALKYRSLFFNDEDLTAYSHPSPSGMSVFDERTYDLLYQTTLRLKMNTVLPATNPFPDEVIYALASKRGLVSTHHHYDLLGLNVYSWPMSPDTYDWDKHPGVMKYVWDACIDAQKDHEILWSVGLRGLNDYAYPCTGDESCGRQISDALGNQTAWIRAVQPNADIVTFLWDEGLSLLLEGYLKIPDGVNIMFTDSGAGYINGDGNLTQYGTAVYYHTAMYNYAGNQLSEMVPVDRVFQQMTTFYQKAKGLFAAVLNLSDMRPVPLSSDAWMKFVWNPLKYVSSNPLQAAMDFYKDWAARLVGITDPATQSTFATLWAGYFALPFIQSGWSDNTLTNAIAVATAAAGDWAGDQSISSKTLSSAQGFLNQIHPMLPVNASSLYSQALSLSTSPFIPASRKQFFQGHTVLQFAFVAMGAQASLAVLNATVILSSQGQAGIPQAITLCELALEQLDALFALQRQAQNTLDTSAWYLYDRLSDFQRSRQAVRQLWLLLSKETAGLIPIRPYEWYTFETYQSDPAITGNYHYIHYSSVYNIGNYIRVDCLNTDVVGGTCVNNPEGGFWRSGNNAALQMLNHNPTNVVRYTLDGTDPTGASTLFSTGSSLPLDQFASAGTVTVRAAAFANISSTMALGYATNAVYKIW